jgi:hypothetical protein
MTAPANGAATLFPVNLQQTSCGNQVLGGAVQNVWTASDYFTLVNPAAYPVNADGSSGNNCGRCVDLAYTMAGATTPTHVVVTVVGTCDAATCATIPNQNFPTFLLPATPYGVLAPVTSASIPRSGETLTYSFVPCPVPNDQASGQPQGLRGILTVNDPNTVVFFQHRYGILSGTWAVNGQTPLQLTRTTDGRWRPLNGGLWNSNSVMFTLTDVNQKTISFTLASSANPTAVNAQFPTCFSTP